MKILLVLVAVLCAGCGDTPTTPSRPDLTTPAVPPTGVVDRVQPCVPATRGPLTIICP